MRTKRQFSRSQSDTRKINGSTIRTMIALLKHERHQYQSKVAELNTILDTERNEINSFLKDMQKILIDLERQRPSNVGISTSALNIQNVRIGFCFVDLN